MKCTTTIKKIQKYYSEEIIGLTKPQKILYTDENSKAKLVHSLKTIREFDAEGIKIECSL